MNTTKRIVIAVIILAAITGTILAIQSSRRGGCLYKNVFTGGKQFTEGCVPVSSGGTVIARFCRNDSEKLATTGFRDKAENKLQEGWLLRDVVLLYVPASEMTPDTLVRIASSSRGKKAELRWNDVSAAHNRVILALTKQGNLKLVSMMAGLDTRERWIQDVDSIQVVKK